LNADQGRNIGLGYVLGGAWGSGSQDGAVSGTLPTLEGMRTSFTQKPETYEADSTYTGYSYWNYVLKIVSFSI